MYTVPPLTSAEAANRLEESGEYRVLRRIQPMDLPRPPIGSGDLRVGLFIDTETTGLDPKTHGVTEIGMVPFFYTEEGHVYRHTIDAWDSLNNPGHPIPADISEITGITDEMVRYANFNADGIADLIATVDLVVAHHANFDRVFVEKMIPALRHKPWACSMEQIPWAKFGIQSKQLEFIAMKLGRFYIAHRALADCIAGVHVLSRTPPVAPEQSTPTFMKMLLDKALLDSKRVLAFATPFPMKDLLKERGYKWHDGNTGLPKHWHRAIDVELLADELRWLQDSVYPPREGGRNVKINNVTPYDRFTDRA